jgi:hypothetical protein
MYAEKRKKWRLHDDGLFSTFSTPSFLLLGYCGEREGEGRGGFSMG